MTRPSAAVTGAASEQAGAVAAPVAPAEAGTPGTVMLERRVMRPWSAQPRKLFRKEKMTELVDSLRSVGQLQALIVRPLPEARVVDGVTHEIIVGERRWRAAETAGLARMEVKVRDLTDKQAAELSLMENFHRDDLTVMEEAQGFALMVSQGWGVAEIADRFGRTQAVIYGLLDLCKLDQATQQELMDGTITRGTARTLGRIEDEADRAEARERIVRPRTQDQPLPELRAIKLIQAEYLEPQARAKAWEKRLKGLAREFPGAEVVSLRESGKYLEPGSGWERADAVPGAHELAVHMRDQVVPTWGELARKHGARSVVVGDAEGCPVEMVPVDPVKAGELAAGEKDAERCVFAIAGGEGRHQQSLAAEKQRLAKEKEEDEGLKAREALQAGLLRHLKGWWGAAPTAGQVAAKAALLKLLWREEYLDGLAETLAEMGMDTGAMEDGVEGWINGQLEEHGERALPLVLSLWAVGCLLPSHEGFAEAVRGLCETTCYAAGEAAEGDELRNS